MRSHFLILAALLLAIPSFGDEIAPKVTGTPKEKTVEASNMGAIKEVNPHEEELAAPPGDNYGKPHGMLGDFTVGPKVTLFGAVVPFRLGLEGKWKNLVGFGFDYGFFPTLTLSSISVGMKSWSFTGKFYPWRGAFYVGVGLGSQTFTGSKTDLTIPDTLTLDTKTTFFLPGIGWRWVVKSGFFFGMELALQVPMSTTTTPTHSNPAATGPAATQLNADVSEKANSLGNSTLPSLALLQFGFLL